MKISLVVPTHNKLPLLRRTLNSLERQDFPLTEFEVLVVDDGSTDDTPAFLAAYSGPLRLRPVRHPANRGRSAARNAALRIAAGDLIVFLDDDMELEPGFLSAHARFHESAGPRVGIGNVVNAPEVSDSPIVRYMSSRGAQKVGAAGPLPWRWFSTNNASVRRSDLESVGLLDEAFVTYGFEDLELGYRLHARLGRTFGFVDGARSLHIHYHDLRDVLDKKYLSGRASLALFIRKHPEAWREIPMSRWETGPGGHATGWRRLAAPVLFSGPVYALLRSLAGFDAGALSDRLFDYLVVRQTLRGLREARAEMARGLTPRVPGAAPAVMAAAAAPAATASPAAPRSPASGAAATPGGRG